jgi:ABC-type antimicrobial peptide transport system permease subunit
LLQYPSSAVTIFFRTKPDTRSVLGAVRNRVQELDPNLPLTNVWPIGEVFSQALWAPRFAASMLGIFALIAMTLCSVGIYGVVSYSVGQRVREMGVRLALGAQPRDVFLMILRQSAVTIGIGMAAGLGTAFVLAYLSARLLSELLFGVNAADPLPFLGTALGLALVGVLASYIPARRAASVDPMVALHYE